jgi:prepilin-type N-terminal cleavage/methylation domain-containing protein
MRQTRGGFTLVELLIAMILVVLVLAARALIFQASTETVNIGEARIDVYTQARYAIDRMQTDLLGCMNFNDGRQAFILENGVNTITGQDQTGWKKHVVGAADWMRFRTISMVGDSTAQCEVEYRLRAYSDTTRLKGNRSQRPIWVLVRKVRLPNATSPRNYDQPATDSTGNVLEDEEIAHFVTSFNIEYYCDTGKYAQLEPSPCPSADPLGDGQGANDTPPTGYRIPKIRVTLTIVDDAGERQERTIIRDLWIPTGN